MMIKLLQHTLTEKFLLIIFLISVGIFTTIPVQAQEADVVSESDMYVYDNEGNMTIQEDQCFFQVFAAEGEGDSAGGADNGGAGDGVGGSASDDGCGNGGNSESAGPGATDSMGDSYYGCSSTGIVWGACNSTRGPGTQYGTDNCGTVSTQSCCTAGTINWGPCSPALGPGTQTGEDGCTTHTQACCTPDCTNKCGGVTDTCGGTCDAICPVTTISGEFKEDLSGGISSCDTDYVYSDIIPLSGFISLQDPTNKTIDCTINNGASYVCKATSTILNDTAPAIFKINQNFVDYNASWSCPDISTTKSVNINDTISNNVYFNLINKNWFKLKDASFHSISSTLTIPYNVIPYDSTDDDPILKKVIIGNAGLISNRNTLSLTNRAYTNYSSDNWKAENYTNQKSFTDIISVIRYIKNKNRYTAISSLNEIADDVSGNNIFILDGNATISNSIADGWANKSLFLIISRTVNFNISSGNFTPANSNIFIAARRINFFTTDGDSSTNATGTIKEARGIFMAETIDTGYDNSSGLKIVGNLLSLGGISAINNRIAGTLDKPGMFVVFDPEMYLETLGTFSWFSYNWTGYQRT